MSSTIAPAPAPADDRVDREPSLVLYGPPVPADLDRPEPAGTHSALLLGVLGVISVICWLMLHEWYGLLEHRDFVHFSFERIQGGWNSPVMRQTALVFLALSTTFGAVIAVLRGATPTRLVAAATIALIAGSALVNVYLYPVGALDAFNYMVELKLAYHYDENPYLTTFAAYRETDPYALPAFLVEITLFYGPAWLAAMWVPTAITGFADVIDTLLGLKVYNALLIGVIAALVAQARGVARERWMAVALFAASPLVLFEGIANAHNDVLLTLFVVGAMLALERRSPLAGPLLALSALVKLYTVALAPIFIVVALRQRWSWRRIALAVALTVVTVSAVSGPWWGDGKLVDGLRAGLEESQEMDHVSPLSLARQYAQEQEAQRSDDPTFVRSRPSFEIVPAETREAIDIGFTAAFAAIALALAAAVCRGRPPLLAAAETLLALFLLMTNLYAWYLIPVIALLAMRPDTLSRAYIIGASALGLIYYPMFIFGHYTSGWTRFQIHQFLALFLTVPILLYLGARLATWRRDHDPAG